MTTWLLTELRESLNVGPFDVFFSRHKDDGDHMTEYKDQGNVHLGRVGDHLTRGKDDKSKRSDREKQRHMRDEPRMSQSRHRRWT